MLEIKRRKGSPNWQIHGTVVTPNASERVRQSSGTADKAQAQDAAAALEARIRRELTYGVEQETTFGDACAAYIEAKTRDGEAVCSPRLADLDDMIGARPLASFSSGEVQDIAKRLYPDAAPATRNRHAIGPFMAVYNFAVLRKWAPPMQVERFEAKSAKTVSVDLAWIEAFRAHCPDPYVRAMCRLMFESGMRLGTAVGLTRAMLDAEQCIIRAPAALLKNDDDHDFPITADMARELASLPDPATYSVEMGRRDKRGRRRNATKLFGFSYNSGIYRHWRTACADAGIDYVPPHQAGRHSFATVMLVDNEVDAVTVASIGGWKDPAFMLRKYPHARHAKMRAIVERISGRGVSEKNPGTPLTHTPDAETGGTVIKLRKSGT